jgi:hypothetical protein
MSVQKNIFLGLLVDGVQGLWIMNINLKNGRVRDEISMA